MKLTLLPLQNDDVIRVRCDSSVSLRELGPGSADPLQTLLGPHCYSHKVLLSLERTQTIDTSGIAWLMRASSRFGQSRGAFVLYAVPPTVTDVLDFLRLTAMLRIAANEPAAREMALGLAEGRQNGPGGNPVGGTLPLPT
jgi:anti-anti-sigma regulatory factor